MATRSLVACCLLLWAQRVTADDESAALAALAVKKNPGIAAATWRIKALSQRSRAAGAWLDPRLAVEYSNVPIDSWALGDHPMSGLQLKLQQTFLFPGKVRLREEVARGEVRQERLLLKEKELQLRAAVKRAYYRLALVRQLEKVTRTHIKLVEQFVDVVRVKYEVGKVGQHDLLRLQLLGDKLRDDLKRHDRDDQALTAAINAAAYRAVRVPIKTPLRMARRLPAKTVRQLTTEAERTRPLLRWYSERAKTRRNAARRAAKEGLPDLTAWLGYRVRLQAGQDAGTDFFSAGISVPIPLLSRRKWRGERGAQEARARSAEEQRAAERSRIRGALGDQIARWKRAVQEARTYKDKLMLQARRTLDATFAAYQVDRADFASLFQSEIQLLEFERTIRRAEAQAALAAVEIEALTGRAIR